MAQGNKRCGPGARATPFEDALAADDLAVLQGRQAAGLPATDMSSGPSSGRSSPTTSVTDLSSGRSSPAAKTRTAWPPLGRELAKELVVPSMMTFRRKTGVSPEEADHFLNGGFTRNELTQEKAVAMMSFVIDNKLRVDRGHQGVEEYAEDRDEDEELPGFDGGVLTTVCEHYSVDKSDFYDTDDSYCFMNGWMLFFKLTSAKVDIQTKRLAMLLVGHPGSPTSRNPNPSSGSTTSIMGDTISDGPSGPSRKGSDVEGNRGRKSRSKKNKLDEDGLDG